MVLDILVILIFVTSTLRGRSKGLGDAAIRLGALVASLLLGSAFSKQTADLIKLTALDERIASNLREMAGSDRVDLADFAPGNIGDVIKALGGNTTRTVAELTAQIMLVFSFIIIVIAVWMIATFLRRKLKKSKREGGLIGTVDSAVGLLFGAIRGAILVLLLLACMFPVAGIFAPDAIPDMTDNLNNSFIAGPLYDANPLLLLIKGAQSI